MQKEKKLPELKRGKWRLVDCFLFLFKVTPLWTALDLLANVLETVYPYLQLFTTASFVDTAISVIRGEAPESAIVMPLVFMFAAFFLNSAVYQFEDIALFHLREKVYSVTKEVFLLKQASIKYRYVEDSKTYDLIGRACNEPAGKMVERGLRVIFIVYRWVFLIITISSVFLKVWWGGLIAVGIVIPAVFLAVRSGLQDYETFFNVEKDGRYAGRYQAFLSAKDYLEERSTFGYAPFILGKWKKTKLEMDRKNLKNTVRNSRRENFIRSLAWVMYATIMTALVFAVGRGELTAGFFVGFANLLLRAVGIVGGGIPWDVRWMAQATKNLGDLSEFSQLEEQEGALDAPADLSGFNFGKIEFRDVSFKYPGTDRYILKNCSFTINEGEHCAFVGVNGAGKTTITKLLTGLYDEYEGDILIGGKNLRDFTYAEIKGMFSVVFQDFAKYQIPYGDSIKLGDVNRDSDEDVLRVTEEIGLTEALEKLHSGVNTPLGKAAKDGVDLSGGEWQRVAIARALYGNRPVSILDEPTAALDPIAESAVYALFKKVTEGKSAVFITHRLGAARIADRILVIDGGAVAEQGSHNELVKAGGIYAEMFSTQKSWYEDTPGEEAVS
ncbi:MAG: ABC transporter ATP-binding protein [Clostridia bacterium]|nr:ABC transporter ATP-binding protein [Clostridia bacterium]